MMLRRDPEAIIAAFELDPERRVLYVEGTSDQAFFNWLTKKSLNSNSMVSCIDEVNLPATGSDDSGGNRGRLLRFLMQVQNEGVSIAGFVDKDQDHLLGNESSLANVFYTDFRDRESYVFFEENLDTALRMGVGLPTVEASELLKSTFETSLKLAAIRLVSEKRKLKLPVSSTNWDKHVTARKGIVQAVDLDRIVNQLFQQANHSLKQKKSVLGEVLSTVEALSKYDPRQVVHGKDTMRILDRQFKSLRVKVDDVSIVLKATFRPELISSFPNLRAAVDFLVSV